MSPSRFSAGMTIGAPLDADEQRERRVDQLRLVGHVGMARCRRVHLLLEHPLVDRADRVLRAAEDLRARALGLRGTRTRRRRGRCGARSARCGTRPRRRPRPRATPSRRRRRRPPCARPRSARARRRAARRPGMRRPVRTITLPPISSRRIRFGEPTSPRPSGVTVAAFSPSPCSRIAAAASWTTPFCVARRPSSERSKRTKLELDADHVRRERRVAPLRAASCPVWSPSRTTIVCTAEILLADRRVEMMQTTYCGCALLPAFLVLLPSRVRDRRRNDGTKDDPGVRQLRQRSAGESRCGDAPQLHGRKARLEAGGSLRRLLGRHARSGCRATRAAGRSPRPSAGGRPSDLDVRAVRSA